MPDNADALWNATVNSNPGLPTVHYSVCAIGDSSYDEFCKAGTDWDDKFTSLGATRIHQIQLCDVDFEPPWLQWASEVLPRIACVNSSGIFEEDLLETMIAYGAGDDEGDDDDGDFTPPEIVMPTLSITMKITLLNKRRLQ